KPLNDVIFCLTENIPTGRGKFTWPDGSTYSGGIVDGVRHGFGTHTCAKTGVSYTGEWSQGKSFLLFIFVLNISVLQGTVYYNESKTSWYKGDWVMNNREGRGERWLNGHVFKGEFKDDKMMTPDLSGIRSPSLSGKTI
uniref:Uncharacterized protein n=1 Tax=Oryzias sinensis TaxID=183150 RepID=A0A8C7ZAP7_9TELE